MGKMNEEGKYGVAVYTPKGEIAKQNIVASDDNYVYLWQFPAHRRFSAYGRVSLCSVQQGQSNEVQFVFAFVCGEVLP